MKIASLKRLEAFCVGINEAAHATKYLEAEDEFEPLTATTDGWIAAQKAWVEEVPGISLIECKLHGNKRVSFSLDEYLKAHPELTSQQRHQVQTDLNSILKAPSLAAFSQRIRRNLTRYQDEPILVKRLNILKDKRFRFTNALKFENASAYSAPLDRTIRFLDEKIEVSGQFRADDAIDPMLRDFEFGCAV